MIQMPAKTEAIDKAFICAILAEQDIATALREKIQTQWLTSPYNEMLKYLRDFYIQYGKTPSIPTITEQWGHFYEAPGESLLYYCDRLKNRQRFNGFAKVAKEIHERMAAAKTGKYEEREKLIPELTELIFNFSYELSTNLSDNQTKDATLSPEMRYQEYLKRGDEEERKRIYIPTPWPILDEEIMGLEGGDLITIIGESGLGKTWLLMLFLLKAYAEGKRALLFTQEMTTTQLMRRFDSMLSKLPYKQLNRGELDEFRSAEYLEFLQRLAKLREQGAIPDFLINQGSAAGGIKMIRTIAREAKPHIIGVDSAYRFAKGSGWEPITELVSGLKDMGLALEVPLVCTTQKAAKLSSTKTAFGAAFTNEATNVIELFRPKGAAGTPVMFFKLHKKRDGSASDLRFGANWDFETMNFGYREDLGNGGFDTEPAPPARPPRGTIQMPAGGFQF